VTKKKSKTTKTDSDQSVESGALETVIETEVVAADAIEAEVVEAEVIEQADPIEDPAETVEEDNTASDVDETDASDTPSVYPVAPPQVIEKKGGFFPILLGGVAAGALGFGASAYMEPKSWPFGDGSAGAELESTIQSQAAELETLQEQIASLEGKFATSAALEETTGAVSAIQGSVDEVSANLSGLDDRLTKLEALPAASGDGESQASLLAFESEMQSLREVVEDQKAALEAAAAEAASTQQSAEEALRMEAARAALGLIQIAGDTGQPFATALNEFKANSDTDIPSILDEVASSGVPTLAQVQADVADNARRALSVSRSEAEKPDSVSGRLSAFLKSQTGARSLTPQEGDDADAVLSRVEGAVKNGQLTDAMAELETLPEVGRAEMSDWISAVNTRLEALNAIDALSDALASN